MIESISSKGQKDVFDYMEERFGMDRKLFSGFRLYRGVKGRVYMGSEAVPAEPKPISAGIVVARLHGSVKPSTNLIQLFGRHAKRNAIGLDKKQALAFIRGEDLEVEPGEATDGYVILRYLGFSLGCGLLKGRDVKSMLPKARRLEVEFI